MEIDFFTAAFQALIQTVDYDFNMNQWFSGLDELSQEIFATGILFFTTMWNHFTTSATEIIAELSVISIIDNLIDNPSHFLETLMGSLPDIEDLVDLSSTNIGPIVEFLMAITSIFTGNDDGLYTDWQTISLLALNAIPAILELIPDEIIVVSGTVGIAFNVGNFLLESLFLFLNHDYI